MITIYKNFGGYIKIPEIEKGCWINISKPDSKEIKLIQEQFGIPEDIVRDILDVDERPRLEYDDNWTLIILRIPVQSSANNGVPFYTVPLGVFITPNHTITLCSIKNEVLPDSSPLFYREPDKYVNDELNFILKLFIRSASIYLKYLKDLNKQINEIEKRIEKSIRNKELNNLLKMEKCFVYFITSLRSNEIVLTKLKNSKRNNINEINEDLFEDAFIEIKQAIDITQIYSNIQSGLMDAFASIISNNLNVVMKQLTSISIILMIPTVIASLYGMNVPNYLEHAKWAFPFILLVSGLLAYIGILLFKYRKWF